MPTGFYDYGPILSYGAVVNMVTGGRGIGKTFGWIELAIKNYIKRGEQFMYVRRYQKEIKEARPRFFDAHIALNRFPDYVFRVQGNEAQIARIGDKKKSWETMGYFVAMTDAQKLKSVPYPKVSTICLDEYILEKGYTQYIPNETHVLLNLLSTVDRNKDTTRVFLLANAVTITNPYFIDWKIKPEPGKIKRYGRGGFIAADFPSSDEYQRSIAHTRMSQFIEGTDYGDYAVRNEFADNSDTMIGRKTPTARYLWSIETRDGRYSIWRDDDTVPAQYFAQAKLPRDERIYTLDAANMDTHKVYATYGHLFLSTTRTAFSHGMMLFDEPSTREGLLPIFKR